MFGARDELPQDIRLSFAWCREVAGQRLDGIALELGELIQEQDAVVRQRSSMSPEPQKAMELETGGVVGSTQAEKMNGPNAEVRERLPQQG